MSLRQASNNLRAKLLLEELEGRRLLSATAIHTGANGETAVTIGNTLYFPGNERHGSGAELWKTDGTSEGTKLVKRIAEDDNAAIRQLTSVGGEFYFALLNGKKHLDELWKSDGTDAGTYKVFTTSKAYIGLISDLTVVGNKLFFLVAAPEARASRDLAVDRLYVTEPNQTTATQLAPTLFDGTITYTDNGWSRNPRYEVTEGKLLSNLTAFGGKLYFAVLDVQTYPYGVPELYRTDGTNAGTQQVYKFYEGDKIVSVAATKTKLFVPVDSPYPETATLWESDGTTAGMHAISPLVDPSSWRALAVNDRLVFMTDLHRLYAAGNGIEKPISLSKAYDHEIQTAVVKGGFIYDIQSFGALWRTDGTLAGTTLQNVLDNGYSSVALIGIAGNSFYYFDGIFGEDQQVLTTDGASGASRVASIPVPRSDTRFISLGGNTYYFSTDSNGDTLYRLNPGMGSITGKVILNSTFGNLPLKGYRVFADTNRNGTFDPDEPTAVSNHNGRYTLSSIAPGEVSICIEKLSSHQKMTTPAANTVVLGPDASAAVNFGFANDPRFGSIIGKVFDDSNGDGEPDPGELGAASITVVARTRGVGSSVGKEYFAQTASDGIYRFDGLPLGKYDMDFGIPDHASQTYESWPFSSVQTIPGQSVAGTDLSYIRDATVRGFIFNDVNGNGVRDSGEAPLPRVRVHVQLVRGDFDDTEVYFETSIRTHSNGRYEVSIPVRDARTDNLRVSPDLRGLRASAGVADPLVVIDWSGVISGYPTRVSVGITDLRIGELQTLVRDYAITDKILIRGKVFRDNNANGVLDYGDTGIAKRLIYVDLNRDGVLDGDEPSCYTNARGRYNFGMLTSGTYIVRELVPRTAWVATTRNAWKIKLGAGEVATSNFGNRHR